jgi:hypothetical protein
MGKVFGFGILISQVLNSTNKDATHGLWSKLVLALIGEQFEFSDGLVGCEIIYLTHQSVV